MSGSQGGPDRTHVGRLNGQVRHGVRLVRIGQRTDVARDVGDVGEEAVVVGRRGRIGKRGAIEVGRPRIDGLPVKRDSRVIVDGAQRGGRVACSVGRGRPVQQCLDDRGTRWHASHSLRRGRGAHLTGSIGNCCRVALGAEAGAGGHVVEAALEFVCGCAGQWRVCQGRAGDSETQQGSDSLSASEGDSGNFAGVSSCGASLSSGVGAGVWGSWWRAGSCGALQDVAESAFS